LGHDHSHVHVNDALLERFPSLTHDEIADRVPTVPAELPQTATGTGHMAALTPTHAHEPPASRNSQPTSQP
jgi:hypothetical protein